MSDVRYFEELGYTAAATRHESGLSVEFLVYEGDEDRGNRNPDALFTGYVKWDGCSNWDFGGERGTTHPLHFCGLRPARQFGELLVELYKWAGELMPDNEKHIMWDYDG